MADLLTMAEAAKALRASYPTVARHVASGSLPSIKLLGRRFIKAETLAAMLNPPKDTNPK